MTQLYFRMVIIPNEDKQPSLYGLKQQLERCGIIVHSMDRLELEKDQTPPIPEILEYFIDVRAENQNVISNQRKRDVYKELALNWTQCAFLLPHPRPLMQFLNDECFLRRRMPCHDKLPLRTVSFGVLPHSGKYLQYATIEALSATFVHDLKELHVVTSVDDDEYAFDITTNFLQTAYTNIRNAIVNISNVSLDLYLDVLHTPLFFQEYCDLSCKLRITRRMPDEVSSEIAGKANTLKLHFEDVNVSLFMEILGCLRNRCDKLPINFGYVSVEDRTPPVAPVVHFNHFGCTYMWEAMMNRTFTILEQSASISNSVRRLEAYALENASCLEKVLTAVLFMIDTGRLLNYWNAIHALFLFYKQAPVKEINVPQKCRLIRRVTFTPTRVWLWPPDLMCENRILRNFDSDFFLRATFRDDDFLQMNIRTYNPEIFDRVVCGPMNNGLSIGDRHYQVLAWSSSQLREHGVSMYARDSNGYTASGIRIWTEISPQTKMNIPKCLARIGQCFSQTEDTLHVPLNNLHVRFEADITGGFNSKTQLPYTFSDGIGKISAELADRVRRTLRHREYCSAFQIRYSGCKGMLVVDPTLRGADIVFRESMRKFDCRGQGHTKLEIAKTSGPIPLRLNRPLIAILHDLKVEPRIFLRLQETMLQNLTDMLLDERKGVSFLHARTPFSTFIFKQLSESGISMTVEPFFRTLLLALHRYYIDLIKCKANIDIDPDYARNMFGVLDETGTLEYGQVFVQYTTDVSQGRTTPDDTKILKGTVMVTKFPCVHSGDVRKFTAVDVPELHHIIDCVVFPRKGPRPHPDEMAGSDLDGDEYAVLWTPDLIFQGENCEAPNYPKQDSVLFINVRDFLQSSRSEEITLFLTKYIQNDQIGRIATAHLAQADQLSIFHPICESIAAKHAISVDFAKTGVSSRLVGREMPMRYPDFMEKFWKMKYNSKKSLGKMYRVSKDFESDTQSSMFRYHNVEVDPNLVVEGWQEFEASAIASLNEYNSSLKTVLQTYGILHETEAFGGAFIKLHHRFRERRDRAEIVNLVHTWLKELVEKTRKEFFENATYSSNDVNEVVENLKKKASAWYIVTYRERNPEFLSFPWVASKVLADIRILKSIHLPKSVISRVPLIVKLESLIDQYAQSGMMPALSEEATYLMQPLIYLCDRRIVETALCVLTKWGDDEKIITTITVPGKFLFYKTFVKLFLHVACLEGYTSRRTGTLKKENPIIAELILSFFRYCMTFRFLSKQELASAAPFFIYNCRRLARVAIDAFHRIAVTGVFSPICYQEFSQNAPEFVDLKPAPLESWLFGRSPIEESKLRQAEVALENYTEVLHVQLRENAQRKRVIVSATGTISSIRELRSLLRKEREFLKTFFATGNAPHMPILGE